MCLNTEQPGPAWCRACAPNYAQSSMPSWLSNLASDFASQNRNGRIQFWIRFRNPILDPISESTMVRAKPPTTVRIQNWIRNWVAGFRPELPALGGLREARQMMAAHRPQKKPFALAPQLCHPPLPAISREFLNPHDENDSRIASFHSRDPKPYVSDQPRNTYWRQDKDVGAPTCVPWI